MNPTDFRSDFDSVLNENGVPVAITNYTISYSGTDYDQEYRSGTTTINTVGIVQPLNQSTSSTDFQFVQQGKAGYKDSKVYLAGSISVQNNSRLSAAGSSFEILEGGIIPWDVSGTTIYKKCFIRFSAGSVGIY